MAEGKNSGGSIQENAGGTGFSGGRGGNNKCKGHGAKSGGMGCACESVHYMRRFMEICMLVLLYSDTYHGYSLAEKLGEFGLKDINVSTLYRTLRNMEAEGWVKSSWEQGGQGPRRRVYTITDTGKTELCEKTEVLKQRKKRIETLLARYEKTINK